MALAQIERRPIDRGGIGKSIGAVVGGVVGAAVGVLGTLGTFGTGAPSIPAATSAGIAAGGAVGELADPKVDKSLPTASGSDVSEQPAGRLSDSLDFPVSDRSKILEDGLEASKQLPDDQRREVGRTLLPATLKSFDMDRNEHLGGAQQQQQPQFATADTTAMQRRFRG